MEVDCVVCHKTEEVVTEFEYSSESCASSELLHSSSHSNLKRCFLLLVLKYYVNSFPLSDY